ncbi:MAG: Nif3-like dinuclear metal center hexameric protein [Methanospirillum sp.]|uniref:Nif3-like dinuclear metal center hexameric protein n=1 Tax=Methanospirillum sp. TaxID=45200 RepID=UPI0023746FDF|nr:Nif3-like dinuclear metal center hexameric protein [Methanospirillum sp.]MDD1728268.1 Nif3-like dinuclear metal center hexameric protein [Methanospirillum sp.]
MKADLLFQKIEAIIPLHLALDGDPVGYIGTIPPDQLEVNNILVVMDYLPGSQPGAIEYRQYDLIVLHHPPITPPPIPAYVIHSNWDLMKGGACDALADCLNIEISDTLDPVSGLGRIGTVRNGPIPLVRFARYVMKSLMIEYLKVVNYSSDRLITRVGMVSGFGLNPELIGTAMGRDLDLFISGDLTHPGAIRAINTPLILMDASHHATELPGLTRLGEILSTLGVMVKVIDTGVPVGVYTDYYRPISYRGN